MKNREIINAGLATVGRIRELVGELELEGGCPDAAADFGGGGDGLAPCPHDQIRAELAALEKLLRILE